LPTGVKLLLVQVAEHYSQIAVQLPSPAPRNTWYPSVVQYLGTPWYTLKLRFRIRTILCLVQRAQLRCVLRYSAAAAAAQAPSHRHPRCSCYHRIAVHAAASLPSPAIFPGAVPESHRGQCLAGGRPNREGYVTKLVISTDVCSGVVGNGWAVLVLDGAIGK